MSEASLDVALALRAAFRTVVESGTESRLVTVPTVRLLDAEGEGTDMTLSVEAEVVGTALRAALPAADALPAVVRVGNVGRYAVDGYARRGRLAGRIALITGGAQGFGRGIADELAADGACVLIADLNETLGRAAHLGVHIHQLGLAVQIGVESHAQRPVVVGIALFVEPRE